MFAGPQAGIAVHGADTIAQSLLDLIPHWPTAAPDTTVSSEISVRREGDDWRITSPQYELSEFDFPDGYIVANGLVGALIAAYVAQDDQLVSVHAAAARIGDGLFLLIGDNFSGKSTLGVALAARGQRFFGDDRLVLSLAGEQPKGRSLAIAPKLRRPLPAEADAGFRDFVADNTYLDWPEMVVLRLGPELAAGFGEEAPLRGLILLQREAAQGPPELDELRQPEVVKLLLEQIFAPHLGLPGELTACARLAAAVDGWRLRYRSAFEASETLIARFGAGPPS